MAEPVPYAFTVEVDADGTPRITLEAIGNFLP